ncbi:MAG: YkvA family protein [Aquincola tertiaricarbonis]|uniref:YkvA family protein n=1 Tax=Aquincola TaxID=391952 RepID=UPI0006153FB4|nr:MULTISPECIES: DUF1232 domain-containing protein [Aquincola]MCR5869047.1 DUF1232 domain-containing protein [Aquincola sp. J276]
MGWWLRFKAWARRFKRDGLTLWFAVRHPGTPLFVKLLAALVAAYAFSPIDLIPDFIPVLGLLDEMVLLPGLIWLALRLMPADVLATCRAQAQAWMDAARGRIASWGGAVLVVALWLAGAAGLWWLLSQRS